MICRYCKYAGLQLALGQENMARIAHEACESPTDCPCQHKIERATRAES
jgi:hypothetical protein